MAGGGGGCNKQKLNKSKNRKPAKSSFFVDGGLLSDWSPVVDSSSSKGKSHNSGKKQSGGRKSKVSSSNSRIVDFQKPKMNAIGYNYPQIDLLPDRGDDDGHNKLNESDPLVLADSKESKIVAFVDQTPIVESETVKYSYECGASFEMDNSFHRGLGFCDKEEEEEEEEEEEASPFIEKKEGSISDSSPSEEIETDIMEDNASDIETLSSPEKNSGFLSIGGMKLYTRDLSDEEDDGDDDDKEDDDDDDDDKEDGDSSSSSDSDSDSDTNDEIAKDCGGGYKDANIYISDDKDGGDIYGVDINDTVKRLGGIALQEASREYGMKKPQRKKSEAKSIKFGGATDDWSAIDDLMLVKDPRISYSQKKKHAAKFPQSWPSKAEKSNHSRRYPGEKKKQRQDTIALKRRERMISRGVDLEKINLKLEQLVQNRGDIMSFELMHSRDCSQVQRLASIYRLRSNSQGSGKRRFVTVTRTEHTGMPSSSDRIRLEKLLGVDKEEGDFTVNGTPSAKMASNRSKKASKGTTGLSPLDSRSTKSKTSGESSKKKRRDKDKTGTYATQPVSFISYGTMASEPVATTVIIDDSKPKDENALPSSYGAFEMHTTGFGSRMMAKMGYVDGGGLGKDGRGIAEPIQVIQRPKSLGLGAEAPETEDADATPPYKPNRLMGQSSRGSESRGGKSGNAQFRSFEKHTKGFGSKMMAKMGYVEGTGLGRESQGILDPLIASRLPKSRGLGAEG